MPAVLTREQAPADTEASTAQTVDRMAQHIRNSAGDAAVVWAAHKALASAGGENSRASDRCRAVFNFLKAHVRFQTDDQLISLWCLGQDELELLVSPPVLLRSKSPVGDCDDFTMCCCAMLHELGVKTQIVTVKADQPDPDRWSHVYCSAETEQGPMTLDTSHGDYPGWEVPFYYAKRTWDSRTGHPLHSEGARVPQPRRRVAGLHGYVRPGRRGMRGMGFTTCATDPSTGTENCFDTPDLTVTPTADLNLPGQVLSPGPSTPSPLANAFASNLSNIINKGFQTLQLSLTPTGGYLVQGPNGQYTIANAAGAAPPALNFGSTGIGMGTILLIGGGLVLLLMVGKK